MMFPAVSYVLCWAVLLHIVASETSIKATLLHVHVSERTICLAHLYNLKTNET